MIENHMKILQKRENLNDREFKQAIEDAAEQHPLLVRFMIASWEFQQFYEVCKEYLENRAESKEYDEVRRSRGVYECYVLMTFQDEDDEK